MGRLIALALVVLVVLAMVERDHHSPAKPFHAVRVTFGTAHVPGVIHPDTAK